jgi:23S rRNA pseudouridine2605 synthase
MALASQSLLCYQARMTDRNDDDKRGRPRGRPDRDRTSGDRPFRKPRDGDRPFRAKRDGDERPRKPREGGDRPVRSRPEGGDKPFRARSDAGNKPFRARRDDDRPRRFERSSEDTPRRVRPDERPASQPQEPVEERIAKVIARAGMASRRDAEVMIEQGRVTVNGQVLTSPALNVKPEDTITVDGEPLPAKERTRLWIFHKPRGLVTTARDPEGRPTVFDSLPEDLPRVVAIGRLDINTEGLLLLTNDGGLARVIAHPDTGWLRRYKVRAHGDVTQADLDRLRDGVTIDEMEYGPVEARLDRVQGDNVWITLGLREGKNREVKRILEHLGLQVNRLIRLSFGPFQLGDLEPGLVEEVKTKVLKDQLGTTLAQEAGVDFESPVREPIAPFGSPRKREREERGERAERPERPERGDRPGRFGRDAERPRRTWDDERPAHGRRQEEEAPKRPSRNEPKRSVWRAGEDEAEPRARKGAPRRGADPREARAATGERPRQRVGAIQAGAGRKVVVERLVSEAPPENARPPRKPHRDRDAGRGFAGAEDRPRRGPPAGERPFRGRRDEGERPRRPRPEGDRPFRSRDDDRPARSRAGDEERPRRGPPRGDAPGRRGPPGGGFKGGPRGGSKGGPSKGGPRGGSKGGPRGRRP